jgi:NAD(P)-dependent dehydrogenase (short-subunit alcohol dehydrogenase family)
MGRAFALGFAEAGADVVVSDLKTAMVISIKPVNR